MITSVIPRPGSTFYAELERERLAKARKRVGAKKFDAQVAEFHRRSEAIRVRP